MSNLEKLHLNVYATMKKTFIDGNNLNKNIVNHMTQLRKFTFDMRSYLDGCNESDLPTNEDLKYTFRNFKNNQIISSIDYFPYRRSAWCTIYTYPYTRKTYYVTNHFPGVLCKSVREITLSDEQHPFEYEFFLRISQSFPLVEKLSLINSKPQLSKESNKDLSIIKFDHLTNITLYGAHDDYIELFLDHTKTSLSNNVHLNVEFEPLKRVTYHFTRNTTRINCEKLKSLHLNSYGLSKYARNYFPHTKIY
jgi:hypothetical protein